MQPSWARVSAIRSIPRASTSVLPPTGWRLDPWPRRSVRFKNSFKRNLGPLRGQADGGRGTFEEAEDHLVLGHQHRAEVANTLAVSSHLADAGLDTPVEGAQVDRFDPDPEAFGDEMCRRLRHAANARPGWRSSESGV
jgi:hypothetical protein